MIVDATTRMISGTCIFQIQVESEDELGRLHVRAVREDSARYPTEGKGIESSEQMQWRKKKSELPQEITVKLVSHSHQYFNNPVTVPRPLPFEDKADAHAWRAASTASKLLAFLKCPCPRSLKLADS